MSESLTRKRRKLSAILMADVSGFSRMMETHEERTIKLIQEFHRRTKELVDGHEGRVVDTAGDSVFGEFDSVLNAVSCAREIQQDQAAINARREPDQHVDTRIGVHLGDVVVQDYHVYGDGVNIAARLESIADPGGICISEAVYQQIQKKLDLPLEDMGFIELKNIEDPVHVYRVPPLGGARRAAAVSGKKPATPVRALAPRPTHWVDTLRRPSVLVTGTIGLMLLLAPVLMFPTGGMFPAAGSILLGQSLGRGWVLRGGRRGLSLLPLGAGIAMGAFWTNWSPFTNALFVTAGVILAAIGVSRRSEKRKASV